VVHPKGALEVDAADRRRDRRGARRDQQVTVWLVEPSLGSRDGHGPPVEVDGHDVVVSPEVDSPFGHPRRPEGQEVPEGRYVILDVVGHPAVREGPPAPCSKMITSRSVVSHLNLLAAERPAASPPMTTKGSGIRTHRPPITEAHMVLAGGQLHRPRRSACSRDPAHSGANASTPPLSAETLLWGEADADNPPSCPTTLGLQSA
jgi:hypothetical protein